jgi:hypothetical protein
MLEISLKMALRAQPHNVVRSVLAQGMKPVLGSLGMGLLWRPAIARIHSFNKCPSPTR